MKRTQDKIKDLVEPQAFDEVENYADDLARALSAYRFTDATSDLLARWLDALADLSRGRGAAHALAGLRGVGKSHTLAAFGALAAFPDLRSTVGDAHVTTSARRLLNRRYMIAHVERGSRQTLQEEIAGALGRSFGGDEADWMGEPQQMLAIAASRAGDSTLVLIIDTAFGREARVKRDDGPVLSQLATATQQVNAFLALALDDDIAGADGANVTLSGTFHIDYLDPEHLYRVADIHLFQKNAQARAALHDIYTSLRTAVPGFNWSEPRFAAIYPVHPVVADVASAVRLYVPSFAFLPFAAGAVSRAAGRPALSLVVLDEVFDRAEYELRKAEDLKDAFGAYDLLATHAIQKIPIMQRLQAKLVLKGLFVLSLDGRGATARELGAAMLLYDENAPHTGIERIESMLTNFAEAAPQGSVQTGQDGSETRYRFNISATAAFDTALAASVEQMAAGDTEINELLRTLPRTRFEDWPLTETEKEESAATDFLMMWRGMGRRGRLIWQTLVDDMTHPSADVDLSHYDWEVVMLAPGTDVGTLSHDGASQNIPANHANRAVPVRAVWRPARITAEELESLRRLLALRTDSALQIEFGEATRAAERTHTTLAERIWERIYLDEGALVMGETPYAFTDQARGSRTLGGALVRMLAPFLGAHYPQHPVFTETLDDTEVARLVGGFFGGANQTEAGVQDLARLFAEPLGLASLKNDVFVPEAGDQILNQPWVREVLAMTDEADGEVVPLDEVYRKLRREPYGLLREAQHLILAALVAGRRIELVTSTGDRIGRRTLDLKLRWDEINGVARAAALLHSAEELTAWARLLTKDTGLASIADPSARDDVRAALSKWLDEWHASRLLEKFDALPDEGLTTRVWNMASAVRKSFGAAAESIEAALADNISLEEGLQRVADAFADSPEAYARSSRQLLELSNFAEGLSERENARTYLATAEPTEVDQIESARRELQVIAEDAHSLFDDESANRFNILWREYQARYSEHYATRHDQTVGPAFDRRRIDVLMRGDDWREFEALSTLAIVNRQYWEQAESLLKDAANAQCTLNVRALLDERPMCACSFRLARVSTLMRIAQDLEETVSFGRTAYRRTLQLLATPLAIALDAIARKEPETEEPHRARTLSGAFARSVMPEHFSRADVQLIEQALQRMAAPPPVRVHLPAGGYGLLTRDELRARLNQWLDDLPDQPALVEVVGESESDAT